MASRMRSVQRRDRRSKQRLGCESLEPRSMLSLSVGPTSAAGAIVPVPPSPPTLAPPPGISLEAGVIRIVGDDRADKAVVALKTVGRASQVFVTLDQATFKKGPLGSAPFVIVKHSEKSFPAAQVSGLYFSGGDGDDSFANKTGLPSLAQGGSGGDSLTGGSAADRLEGGAGADYLEGGGGDDLLIGGNGDDWYFFTQPGTLGTDTIREDPGRDTDRLDFSGLKAGITLSLSSTATQAVVKGVLSLVLESDTGVEDVNGGSGNDHIEGNDRYNRIYGGKGIDDLSDVDAKVAGASLYGEDGNDHIIGSQFADELDGGAGVDYLEAHAGDDVIHAGPGNDVEVYGEEGNDKIYGDDGNDKLDGGEGDDTIEGGAGDDVLYDVAGANMLDGGFGNDKVFGGLDPDVIAGGPGDDELYGNGGNDAIWGEDGSDLLRGGDGTDMLDGGAGMDSLFGGAGVDILRGGPGSDRFLQQKHVAGGGFLLNSGEDVIVDADGRDTIPLFADSAGTVTGLGWIWGGQNWEENDILEVDEALGDLHLRTGNPALLQHFDSGYWVDDIFYRIKNPTKPANTSDPAPMPTPETLAFNAGGSMAFPANAFSLANSRNFRRQIVQHELGHNFQSKTVMDAIFGPSAQAYTKFVGLSNWLPVPVGIQPPKGFIRGGEDNVKSPTDWIYSASAVFASGYGKQNPNEDFATSFESAIAKWAGRTFEAPGRTVTPVPLKWAFVDNLIAKAGARKFSGA